MTILHISTRLILGGSQENTVLSCEGQARLGHEVHLAYGPIYGPEGSLLERVTAFNARCAAGQEDAKPITTYIVPDLCREIDLVRDVRCVGQLQALIKAVRPDVVHTHSSKAGILGRIAAYLVWQASKRKGESWPAVVHTIHGPPFMPIEGGWLRRTKVRINNAIYTRAEKTAANKCHRIVSVADAMTRQFLARGIGTPELYETVRSGMEIEPYLVVAKGGDRAGVRESLGFDDTHLVIGTVARLAEHKGHDDIIAAITQLSQGPRACNMSRWRLLWIGDGWCRERLIANALAAGLGVVQLDRARQAPLARAAGKLPTVVLTGLVPPQRIASLMRAMDVLCHPSYREGLPRTVPQALLAKVCPVAYDCDGTGEVCIDMQTGRLVPTGDTAQLAAALDWCARNPDQRAMLAEAGHVKCIAEFSAQAMVHHLEGVYARAMGVAVSRAR